jgi:PST family polysaccharide transporter
MRINEFFRSTVFKNFGYLSLLKIITNILPLVTYPFLYRAFGIYNFGKIAFAQSFIQYFLIIVDFGFNLSGTRQISYYRDNKHEVNKIITTIYYVKVFILLLCFISFMVIINFIPYFSQDKRLFYFAFISVIGNAFFPVWFFQGIENMRFLTIINTIARFINTFLIFIFINGKTPYEYAMLFFSFGYFFSGIVSFLYMLYKYKICYINITKKDFFFQLKDTFHYFISRVFVSIYTNSNTFILGLFSGPETAGIYAAAEKIYYGIKSLYDPIYTALYPYMVKERNTNLLKVIFKYVVLSNSIVIIFLLVFSNIIMNILYDNVVLESTIVFKILLVACIVTLPSILLGYPFLGSFGKEKVVNSSVIIASIFHICVLLMLYKVYTLKAIYVAILVFITESIVLFIRVYFSISLIKGVSKK